MNAQCSVLPGVLLDGAVDVVLAVDSTKLWLAD